jgi:hypothetical protein
MADQARAKLTDSPWFWIELFALVAMIGVIVISPKFLLRQGQLERRLEGRQHALERDGETLPEATQAAPLEERRNRVRTSPLLILLALVVIVAHVALLRQRFSVRQRTSDPPVEQGTTS